VPRELIKPRAPSLNDGGGQADNRTEETTSKPLGCWEKLDRPVRHWKTEVVIAQLEMLSGRGKKEYAKEAQTVAAAGADGLPTEAAADGAGDGEATEEALVAL